MSANTSKSQEISGVLARIASLIATAIDLILKDRRARAHTNLLLQALQLYKENRLEAVYARHETLGPDNCRARRSGKIYDHHNPMERQTIEWAKQMVDEYASDPGRYAESTPHFAAALVRIRMCSFPAHQCYWNDAFWTAVTFNMSGWTQRAIAWHVACNGLNGYWEGVTHDKRNMVALLEGLGIDLGDKTKLDTSSSYSYLPKEIVEQLVVMYDLPTTAVGPKTRLTEDEERERKEFMMACNYTHGL